MQLLQAALDATPVWRWPLAAALALVGFVLLKFVKSRTERHLAALAARTTSPIDDFLADLLRRRTSALVMLMVAAYVGSLVAGLPPAAAEILRKLALLALFWQAALWGDEAVGYWLNYSLKQRVATDPESASAYGLIGIGSRAVLWAVVLLAALHNAGVNITALVAGLGVAGVAVALAVQSILSDLFASLSILLDKPFVVGDFIIVGDYLGTVERIGIKTTRVRSLSGEQLIFSNSDLLSSRIRNFKRMQERRVLFTVGVTYQTPYEKLKTLPGLIRSIVESQPQVRFDRAHFARYGDFALILEVVYYVLTPDYNTYMDVQQAINLEIFRRFAAEGVEFAYPTQTIHLAPRPAPSSDSDAGVTALAAPPGGGPNAPRTDRPA